MKNNNIQVLFHTNNNTSIGFILKFTCKKVIAELLNKGSKIK